MLTLQSGDSCIIWGDLHGAYHSLVRDLTALKKEGYIDDRLTLTNKNRYLIFIGDLISRSPYSLETLHIVLLLMKKNPKNVFYLRGKHENRAHWQGFSMHRALKYRFKHKMGSVFTKIPLVQEINDFFARLPKALFIVHEKTKNKICVSHWGGQEKIA